jgi:hypothetical protein
MTASLILTSEAGIEATFDLFSARGTLSFAFTAGVTVRAVVCESLPSQQTC